MIPYVSRSGRPQFVFRNIDRALSTIDTKGNANHHSLLDVPWEIQPGISGRVQVIGPVYRTGSWALRTHTPIVNGGMRKKVTPEPSDVWTETDFPEGPPAHYGIPSAEYRRYKAHKIGRQVGCQELSDAQLEGFGCGSWKEYQLHRSLGNF